jgi:two-component system cell cycle response regulator DivK
VPASPASTHTTITLLVQPERDDRDMYAEYLRHAGLIPIVVSHAVPALALAPDADVVVTALLLPGHMDGIALIGQLRHQGPTKHIPIIVLTSSAWDTERDRALAAGADVFLPKPCLPDRLLAEIRRLLALGKIPKPQPAQVRPHASRQRRQS